MSLDPCIIWPMYKDALGYGIIRDKGKLKKAHRVVWELYNGKINSGLFVCHKCDNPSCVNIEHLFLGTPKQNSQDRNNKKRQARKETHGKAILTTKLVMEIRTMWYSKQHTQKEIGAFYGIKRSTVQSALRKWGEL